MASISLEELIGYLGRFQETTTNQALEMLREEIPVGLTGNMLEHTEILAMGDGYSVIGVNEVKVPYAQAVLNGRGPVKPKSKKALMWEDYDGKQTSIHHGTPKQIVFSKYSGPTEPNDFISRAKQKILSADLDIGGFKGWARRITRRLGIPRRR